MPFSGGFNNIGVPTHQGSSDRCWNGTLDPNWSTDLSTGTVSCSSPTSEPNHYHVGNYYNWTAAVAMADSSSYTADNTDANQSICPAGWRLPIGGTSNTGSKSFEYLVNQLSLSSGATGNIQDTPVYFVYGGYWFGSSYSVSSDGFYWSSVIHSLNFHFPHFHAKISI